MGRLPADWPNAAFSRFIDAPPHRWHVQEAGTGPTVLLLHGAGGSVHSFRDILPGLARDYHVVALDLPGQGFTRLGGRGRCGLAPMAEDIARLLAQQGWAPAAIIGHSAGAPIALQLALNLPVAPCALIGLNAALGSFGGLAGLLFPVMAKALALTPFTATVFARTASSEARVRALIGSTGSTIDAVGMACYRTLVADRVHVDGTLLMMSQWTLDGVLPRLPGIAVPTLFIVGDEDQAVPPRISERAAARMPAARVLHMPRLGHLSHEEAPAETLRAIGEFLAQTVPRP